MSDPQTTRDIQRVRDEKLAWARTLPAPSKKAWLDFYEKFFATDEGLAHLALVAVKRARS